MATSLEALLRIKADVSGTGQVNGLTGALSRVETAAKGASTGMLQLTNAAGMSGLAGAFSKLTPLLTAAGLVSLTKSAIDAGNEIYLISQRTGASVEMLAKLKKAASMTGTEFAAVETALIRLSRAMGAAAAGSQFGQKTKQEIDKAVQAVKDGEREQLYAVKYAADTRINELKNESNKRLDELEKRYRKERQMLEDSWEDQSDAQAKAIRRSYEVRREAVQNDKQLTEDQRRSYLQNLEDQEDNALKILRRANRDRQQEIKDSIDARQKEERQAIEKNLQGQEEQIRRLAERSSDAIRSAADNAKKALTMEGRNELAEQLDALGLSGKGASDAFMKLGINIKTSTDLLRDPGDVLIDVFDALQKIPDAATRADLSFKLLGRGAAQLNPLILMGGSAIRGLNVAMTEEFAKNARQYSQQLTALGGAVGKLGMEIAKSGLLIGLIEITKALTDMIIAFNNLDPQIKKVIVAIGGLAIAWKPIMYVLGIIGSIGVAIGGLGATIAGWAGAVGPIISAIGGAFTTLGSIVAGIFTGPIGWAALLIAAGAALYVFRDQVKSFLTWWGDITFEAMTNISRAIYDLFIKPFVNMFETLKPYAANFIGWFINKWQDAAKVFNSYVINLFVKPFVNMFETFKPYVTGFINWFGNRWQDAVKAFNSYVINPIKSAWNGMVNALKNAFNSFLKLVFSGLNKAITATNKIAGAVNTLPGVGNRIGYIANVGTPQFASGGVVNSPTLAMVGEGGQREYIVPEAKMARASANYLAGARGAAVLSGSTRGTPVSINITTGPVLEQNGQRYVSINDLEKAMRATADGVMSQLRTPTARMALGLR